MNLIDVYLTGGKSIFGGKESPLEAHEIYCDNCDNCSLYKNKQCLNHCTPFALPHCKLGSVINTKGYTSRAKKYSDFKSKYTSNDKYNCLTYPNAVIHVINGILTEDDVAMLQNNNLKMLILGYKELRRGNEYLTQKYATVKYNQLWLYNNLDVLFTKFNTVSFDNLAIEQLEVKRLMSESEWEQFYMGDDGSSTFYIDMVNHQFARSSTAPMNKRYDLLTSVDNMFKIILTEKAGKKSES